MVRREGQPRARRGNPSPGWGGREEVKMILKAAERGRTIEMGGEKNHPARLVILTNETKYKLLEFELATI